MPILTRIDELSGYAPHSWRFWRNLVVYFCVLSVMGHWIEILYCLVMNALFGVEAPGTADFGDPMYPFLVYGIGAAVCILLLVPLRDKLIQLRRTIVGAGGIFYVITVFICMAMELAMGLLLNRPDANGVYPLWDNSHLPLNIFGQAWLVNDVMLGLLATFFVWIVYPLLEKLVRQIPDRTMHIASTLIIAGFVVLCAVKFA